MVGYRLVHHMMAAVVLAAASSAHAQWSYVILHPEGQLDDSQLTGLNDRWQSGWGYSPDRRPWAACWSGSAESWIKMHPSSKSESAIEDIDGDRFAGYTFGDYRAAVWMGPDAGSWVDFHPAGASTSSMHGLMGDQYVGGANFNGVWRAILWEGNPSNWIDLTPPGASSSGVSATIGTQQVGQATFGGVGHAGFWTGTADSWVDLHPAGAIGSNAVDTTGVVQVGLARFESGAGKEHAGLWRGTPGSWVDLTPDWAERSSASATAGEYQVGFAGIWDDVHAVVWRGNSDSCFELESVLPSRYYASRAQCVYVHEDVVYVGGWARNSDAGGRFEAVMWVGPALCPADFNGDGAVDTRDFVAFLNAWAASDPSADFDGNGVIDTRDFIAYLNLWAAGC